MTAVGQLFIDDIHPIIPSEITTHDAVAAGFKDLEELFILLDRSREGTVYKIMLHYHREDYRLDLRNMSAMDAEELEALSFRLNTLDSRSRTGPWTRKVLHLIEKHPRTKAALLAERSEIPTKDLKRKVRQLKNLGLTISHEVGYSVSPRGKTYMHSTREE